MTFRHDYFGERDTFQTNFTATNLNQETAGYENGDDAYKNTSESKTNEYPDAYRDAKSARLSVRWDHDLSESSSFSLTPYVRHTEMNFLMHFLPGTPVEDNEHDSVGILAAYYKDLEGGHKIIVGTDLEYTEGSLSEVQYDPNSYTSGKYIPGVHYDYDVDATVVAPYIHSEWQVADKTRVTLGARFEHTRYEYTNNTVGGTSVTDNGTFWGTRLFRPNDSTDTFNNFTPKLGLVQALSEDTSAFINLTKGNRAPQTTDLYRVRKDQPEQMADSESTDSIEVGVRKVGSGLQYELTSFYMKKKDYFFRTAFDNNIPDGKTKHYGIELSAFVPLTQTVDLSGSFTYARHQYDFDNANNKIVDGNDMDTAPRHVANVRLGWNFMPESRAELEWVHVSRYYTDEGNLYSYDGHDLLNLYARHQVSKQVTVYGKVNNVLNTEYAERADNSYGTQRYFVGEERGLHVGASYSF
jgi:outer membrane receptor protein involved in Fe transport